MGQDGGRQRPLSAEAADIWAQGYVELDVGETVAVFVRALAAHVSFDRQAFGHGSTTIWSAAAYGDLPRKPLSEWRTQVGHLNEELARLAPGAMREVREECCSRLLAVCEAAATGWRSGNPERPPTLDVARDLARVRFDCGCYDSWDWRAVRP
jgi:hypothetical protein